VCVCVYLYVCIGGRSQALIRPEIILI